jgi:hypothetical protein
MTKVPHDSVACAKPYEAGESGAQGDSLQVDLYPEWRPRVGYRYTAFLNGEEIVSCSPDPEHDIARALLARGLTGIAEIVDGATGKSRTRVNINEASRWRMVEEDRRGLRRRRWVPPGSTAPHAGRDTSRRGALPGTPFGRAKRSRPRSADMQTASPRRGGAAKN